MLIVCLNALNMCVHCIRVHLCAIHLSTYVYRFIFFLQFFFFSQPVPHKVVF